MMLATASPAGLRVPLARNARAVCHRPGFCQRRIGVRVQASIEPQQAASSVQSAWETAVHHINLVASLAEDAAVDAAAAASTASAVAPKGSGPFDFLAIAFENVLEFLDEVLEKANVPYSYGFAIILLTVMVKVATFPLSQKQVQSTVALQALQPRVKELQAKYANDTETLQLETARLYRDAGVNPLAGCLPTLATIPVFIGLYRALTLAAEDNLLDSDFFWIPSLAGPAAPGAQAAGAGMSWLFPFVDGHPPIGWGPAAAYLVLPVLLVVSQYISQKIISPPASNDPQAQQSQAILKFLPLMIGWFSLNVPAGLTLYWFVNNILSTGQQVYLKRTTKINIPDLPEAPAGTILSSGTPYISPKEEKVKKVSGKELNARKPKRSDDVVDVTAEVVSPAPSSNGSSQSKKNKGGDKFRARKAREAAAKAASAATAPAPSSSTTTTATAEAAREPSPAPPQSSESKPNDSA